MQATETRRRRPWVAGLLNLFFPPLGHVYAGRLLRGVSMWFLGLGYMFLVIAVAVYLPVTPLIFNLLIISVLLYPAVMVTDAVLAARRRRDTPRKGYQRWWFYLAVPVVVIVANHIVARSLRAVVCEAFVIPTRAMAPTIQAGDRIVVDKLCVRPANLSRGDLVVFFSDGPGSPCWIMRVAGLPGDTVEVKNERIFVNGKEWAESHAVVNKHLPLHPQSANYGPMKVPADSFFVLGDNRRLANDSRLIGPIPLRDLYGKAKVIYWSRERNFPNPQSTEQYNPGRIQWERIGMRLD